MTSSAGYGSSRFYAGGEELAEDLGTALLGIVPPGAPVVSEIGAAGAVHASIASLIVEPHRAAPLEIVMIGGVPGDVERAPFAWSLALALEEAGRRVLIVDADLGISAEQAPAQGFAELVRSGAALDGLIRRTGRPRIDLLPPGSTPLSAVERCDADELAGAFRAVRSAADVVLLGAPLLSRSGKASRFVTFADAVILVVRLDLDTRDVVRRTYLQLWGVEAPLLGVVSVEMERRLATGPIGRSYLLGEDALDPTRELASRSPAPRSPARGEGPFEVIPPEAPPDEVPLPESAVSRAAETAFEAAQAATPATTVPPLPRPPVPAPRGRRRTVRRSTWVLGGSVVLVVAAAAFIVPTLTRGPERLRRAAGAPAERAGAAPGGMARTPSTSDRRTPAAQPEAPAARLEEPAADRASAFPAIDSSSEELAGSVPTAGDAGAEAASAGEPATGTAAHSVPIPAEAAPGEPAAYTLQVASFPDENDAHLERTRLAASGYEIDIERVDLAAKGTWYRVFFGRFASEEDALKASEAIRSRGLVKEALLKPLDREAGGR